MEVIQALIEVRKERGLSQRALAEKIGMSQSQLARLESGKLSTPNLSTLNRVCEGLGCTLTVVTKEYEGR